MRNVVILIIAIASAVKSFSQINNNEIIIAISNLTIADDSLTFRVKFTNSSNRNIIVFKPDLEYINYGLLQIELENVSTNEKFLFENGQRGDIDKISLSHENCIILKSNQSFTSELKAAFSKFTPKLAKGEYRMHFALDYSIVNFSFPSVIDGTIYKGKFSTYFSSDLRL